MRLAFLLVAVVTALIVSAQGQLSSKRTPGTAAISQCYSELGYPPGFFDEILKTRKIPSTSAEACFLGCVDRRLGLIRNGGIDVEWSKQVAHILYGSLPDKLNKAIAIINLCGAVVKDINSECTLGFAARKCLIMNSDSSFAPVESEIARLLP